MKPGILAAVAALAIGSAHGADSTGPLVELGYATYRGYYSSVYDLNIWKSVRYATPPTGERRWQPPQPPQNAKGIVDATKQPPLCPQTGAYGIPKAYGFNSGLGDEDCLFLNVYAAPNATKLPVIIWIHGGGHSVFGATYDPSVWMNANGNGFITVELQYRLGAFGFLASSDVKENGVLNAGLLDQRFAMEWVQKHISKFGGDPSKVTIGGESSGAGAVMFHALAYGGKESHLFSNVIAASPYNPPIYSYSHPKPRGNYDAFARIAGCGEDSADVKKHGGVFKCLVAADTKALQHASGKVSTTRGYFGSFAFLPVIDGDYIRELPSQQLLRGQVSGKRLLVGTNANEGVPLTNPDVDTRAKYDEFIKATFPNFSDADTATLNAIYKVNQAKSGNNETRFDTLGDTGPTALNQSGMATGIQQAAFNIAAETVFQCPAQWMAEAFGGRNGRTAWKYQFSPTPSFHGADLSAYFSVNATHPGADFRHAFHKIWGSFVTRNTPVISMADARIGKQRQCDAASAGPVACRGSRQLEWPAYTLANQQQMDLNTTGGHVRLVTVTDNLRYYVRSGDDVVNVFRLVNSQTWEGGRVARCAVLRGLAQKVPQ